MFAIAVHGGAGRWRAADWASAMAGVTRAASAGREALAAGGSALDAAVAAVVVMEDDAVFNAGTGSVLNWDGEAEMDAGVMDGSTLSTGNVACLRSVRNPVLVARRVMEDTDHLLLSGDGALAFARRLGFGEHQPVTDERRVEWREKRARLAGPPGERAARLRGLLPDPDVTGGNTVGAVALDVHGNLAAATSTGGTMLKMPGRIGDTPIPGAGNWASGAAAASATGHGELMIRYHTAWQVCEGVRSGESAQAAVDRVLADMARQAGTDAGIIAVDRSGGVGIAHHTAAMPHAWATSERARIFGAMARDE